MTSASAAPDPRVVEAVAARAEPDGFVPFDRFMEVALYHPTVGYYARGGRPLGPHGDFYTAVHVHPMFARCVAARALEAFRELSPDRPVRWVELGPGDGRLSEVVVVELRAKLGDRLAEAVLVDRSEPLLLEAAARLRQAVRVDPLPVRTVGSIGELGPFEGVVFANELFDAQPVQRFRFTGGVWRELGVRQGAGGLIAAEREAGAAVPPPERLPTVAEGTVYERPLRAEAIVREVADHLGRGAFLALDFGADETELLASAPRGTLATARRHRPGEDPLAAPGEEDLSTFVNFTRLRTAAQRAGLREKAFLPQAEALVAWGLEGIFKEELSAVDGAEAEVKTRLALKSLLYNFGTFRAVEWESGPARPVTS